MLAHPLMHSTMAAITVPADAGACQSAASGLFGSSKKRPSGTQLACFDVAIFVVLALLPSSPQKRRRLDISPGRLLRASQQRRPSKRRAPCGFAYSPR